MNPHEKRKLDLQAIELLHQKDELAAQLKDFETLLSILSEDVVAMPPGRDFIRGREAMKVDIERSSHQLQNLEILSYDLVFEEVEVLGDYAFEWGQIQGTMRLATGEEVSPRYHVMRILKRHAQGEWRVHRTIWNEHRPLEVETE